MAVFVEMLNITNSSPKKMQDNWKSYKVKQIRDVSLHESTDPVKINRLYFAVKTKIRQENQSSNKNAGEVRGLCGTPEINWHTICIPRKTNKTNYAPFQDYASRVLFACSTWQIAICEVIFCSKIDDKRLQNDIFT